MRLLSKIENGLSAESCKTTETSAECDTRSGNLTMEQPIENAGNQEMDKAKWWQSTSSKRVGTALLVVAVAGTVIWRIFFYPFVSTDDARVTMTVVRIASFGTGGRIIKVNVEEGSRVKAGDVLIELDHRVPQQDTAEQRQKLILQKKSFNVCSSFSNKALSLHRT